MLYSIQVTTYRPLTLTRVNSIDVCKSYLPLKLSRNWITLRRNDICIELQNESGGIGYVGLQVMKGRVIIIDNEVIEKMIVKEKYVLARTHNVELALYNQQ
jgi:hypothetical protein